MKQSTHLVLGLVSSLLLLAGLSHAAERLDPLAQQIGKNPEVSRVAGSPSQGCTFPCAYAQPRNATGAER